MKRRQLVDDLTARLGSRELVWVGTRGDDVESAMELPNLGSSVSIISAYRRRPSIESIALEDLTGVRVDLDTFDLDDHLLDPEVRELRRYLLRTFAKDCYAFTYRPTAFLSAICFARRARCTYLGMFRDHQSAFEHKPWMESAIAGLGLPVIPWQYIADEEQLETLSLLEEGPIMLRRSRTTGGVGLTKVTYSEDVVNMWPRETEAFVSVAPFIEGAIPLNVSGVVFRKGVTVHPLSVQLIGISECTTRPFGYCGNDFARARQLDPGTVERVDQATVTIGEFLQSVGYRGAFGVDFLAKDGVPYFTEVNPRFQGSTHASCQIAVEEDESCLLTEHIAALLDMDAPPRRTLMDWLRVGDLSHVVWHWTGDGAAKVDVSPAARNLLAEARTDRIDVSLPTATVAQPGATLMRTTIRGSVTQTGYELAEPWRRLFSRTVNGDSERECNDT